jgi:hypothetical protein
MVSVRFQGLCTLLQRVFEVFDGKWHWLAILFHQLAQLFETAMKSGEFFDKPTNLSF